jgi:hypothetical protein
MIVLKSFLVYVSDIFSAVTMLTTNGWHSQIYNDCENLHGCFYIPFTVGRWLFVGCIFFSFLLVRQPWPGNAWVSYHLLSLCFHSWLTRLARAKKSSPVATFRMLLPMSWPIITTPSVCFHSIVFHQRITLHRCVQGRMIISASSNTSAIPPRQVIISPSSCSLSSRVSRLSA